MSTVPDRWTCPACPTTLDRDPAETRTAWEDRLRATQENHGRRHAADEAEWNAAVSRAAEATR